MKVVINRCFGGFSLSWPAVKLLAELKGRPCFFFRQHGEGYTPLESIDGFNRVEGMFSMYAFDIPNPNSMLSSGKSWNKMTTEERVAQNKLYEEHSLNSRPEDRADPDLVRVVEELGEAANGACAELSIVEIPDGIEWEIDEYDGRETIAEVHRRWY